MRKNKITYSKVGDDFDTKDPVKKLAQNATGKTSVNLKKYCFESIDAGYVAKGKRQVIIKLKNIVYKSETLDMR